jgi:colicin import membrane protein
MNKVILMTALMMGSVMADPGVSVPTLTPNTSIKMADGDVMRMMAVWKDAEKAIANMQQKKIDPEQIMAAKRHNNDLKMKIEEMSAGNDVLKTAWAKTQADTKSFRDKKGLVQHPSDELAKKRSDVAKYYDDKLAELDAQLRIAEEAKANRLQEIGIAGLQGTMDEATKAQERESATRRFDDFKSYTAEEKKRLEAEKEQSLASVR